VVSEPFSADQQLQPILLSTETDSAPPETDNRTNLNRFCCAAALNDRLLALSF